MLKIVLILSLWVMMPLTSTASPLDNAISAMCENLKKCTLQHLELKQKVTADTKQILESAFDKKCDSMKGNHHKAISPSSSGYKKALACVEELSTASCDDLMKDRQALDCLKIQRTDLNKS